jgi:hypothetical protein
VSIDASATRFPYVGAMVLFNLPNEATGPASRCNGVVTFPACVVRLRTPEIPTTRLDLYVMTLDGSRTYLNVPYGTGNGAFWWQWMED